MNYGMYLSAAGALTGMHRMDVLANNLANVNTIGFKPDVVVARQRLPERLESAAPGVDPQFLLERLGGGQWINPTQTNLAQAEVVQTHNPLDLALRGDGFFVVSSGQGAGNERLRFTRDGRFTLNAQNELVMAVNGLRVLDERDQPIRLTPDTDVRIGSDGRIIEDGVEKQRLQVASIPNRQQFRKHGDNLFRYNNTEQVSRVPSQARIEQGWVESSGVDPIMALNDLIGASKAVEANARLIQYHDNLTDQAINRFGRIA